MSATLTGRSGGGAYVEPQPVYVEREVVVQPDYVYYPGYAVYYSSNTRQYVYREGRSWVVASPSVQLDFHDSLSVHHAAVVKQYPKHWAPPAASHGRNEGRGASDAAGKTGCATIVPVRDKGTNDRGNQSYLLIGVANYTTKQRANQKTNQSG